MERKRVYVALAGSLIAVSLMLGGGAGAADPQQLAPQQLAPQELAPKVRRIPAPPTLPCPPGWRHVDDPNFPGACQAKKPNPVKCPPNYQWEDNGCTVGCRYVPG